jgi:hypothetical protein
MDLPSAAPLLGADGCALRDTVTGKIRFAPTIQFLDQPTRDRFSPPRDRTAVVVLP